MNLTPTTRKVTGLSVIILVGLLQVAFLAGLIYYLFTDLTQAFSFAFVVALLAFPFWWGFKMWKSGMTEKLPVSHNSIIDDTPIVIETKVTLAEYRKVVYMMTYTMPAILFVHLIGLVFIGGYFINGGSIFIPVFAILFLLYLPIAVHRSAGRVYNSSKTLHERIVYTFTPETIVAKGETSDFTVQWQSLHKAKETKDWFLIYTNTQSAMVIPKKTFHSNEEIERLRMMTKTLS
jgi:hypothetical protein